MTMGAIVDVRGVTKRYRRGTRDVCALRDVSLAIDAGSAVAIMGRSGSGKTTLLHLMAGLDRPSTGDVVVAGVPLHTLDIEASTAFRRRHVGFVFQFFNLLATMSALENVGLPLLAESMRRREATRRAREALEAVGLADRADHHPDELSGGEQQRVAIARAIVMRPPLLLADEPTGNLDSTTGAAILALLRGLVERQGMTLVMVTHAPEAAAVCDRRVTIRDGIIGDGDERAGAA